VNLKSRLSRLQDQAGTSLGQAQPKPSLSSLRERIAALEQRGRSRLSPASNTGAAPPLTPERLAGELGGEQIADGVIRIRQRLPLQGRLGRIDLQHLRGQPRLPGDTDQHRLRQVYIDTETTGLSGGSGTLAFLIGTAVVEHDAIQLTQFLLTRFGAEGPLLSAFSDSLSAHDRLVSYNGKSYDLPLLVTRFRMQAMTHPFDALPHLDLLHPVRRLYGRRWSDCRLLSVERHLLGFQRVDDLPGSEAPAAWFDYLRCGQGRQLIRVVEHNRQDIVSLAVAHGALAQTVAQPEAFDADIYALARWLAEHDPDAARHVLQSREGAICDDGKRLLGQLLRRSGHWREAVAIWETLAQDGCQESLERLAKYHEHVSKDLAAAQRCCAALLPHAAAHDQRRRRIEEKLHKQRGPAGAPLTTPTG